MNTHWHLGFLGLAVDSPDYGNGGVAVKNGDVLDFPAALA
jgi:hypothetical protein